MPEDTLKNNLSWTEEHDAYCYKHHIPPAAKSLWQWLIRQGEVTAEIEPDLSEFNAWVAKQRGKPYAHNYLKQMFELLQEKRLLQVVKKYSWKIFKLLVRPLEWLKPPRKKREKNLHNKNFSYNPVISNGSSAVPGSTQQQHSLISENQELLFNYGIQFDESVAEVLNRPVSDIKLAIKLFELRGGFEKIENPEGFIRGCLRGEWWSHPTNYRLLLQKYGNTTEWDELFPSG
jgi:hypothetical protein